MCITAFSVSMSCFSVHTKIPHTEVSLFLDICGGLVPRPHTYIQIPACSIPTVGPAEPEYRKSQYSLYMGFTSHKYCIFNLCLVGKKKNPRISRTRQFKPMLFKGDMYLHSLQNSCLLVLY